MESHFNSSHTNTCSFEWWFILLGTLKQTQTRKKHKHKKGAATSPPCLCTFNIIFNFLITTVNKWIILIATVKCYHRWLTPVKSYVNILYHTFSSAWVHVCWTGLILLCRILWMWAHSWDRGTVWWGLGRQRWIWWDPDVSWDTKSHTISFTCKQMNDTSNFMVDRLMKTAGLYETVYRRWIKSHNLMVLFFKPQVGCFSTNHHLCVLKLGEGWSSQRPRCGSDHPKAYSALLLFMTLMGAIIYKMLMFNFTWSGNK